MHDLIGHRWPVKVRLARHCPAGRGRQGPRVGGLDRTAGRLPGPCRCLRSSEGCRPGRGTCRSPPRFLIRGSLENRAEVAEALENPRVPAYVEVRPEDAVPPEDRKELVLRNRE